MKLILTCTLALIAGIAPGEEPSQSPSMTASNNNEVAVIKTSEGEMVAEFWSDVAPKTVDNFKKLAREGFYDGTAFHRIVKGFMIQGGDPNTKDLAKESSYGTGGPGYKIKAEFNEKLHEKGVLSMARSGDPDSAGSQFFVMLGRSPHLDRQYTAFGKLINRITPLFHQRADDLPFLCFVEVAPLFDALVHERCLQHPKRHKARRILLAHRVRDRSGHIVQE